MVSYKIKEESLNEIRNKGLLRSIPLLIITLAFGILLTVLKPGNNDVNVLPILIPMILTMLGVTVYINIKRQRTLFESYVLTICDKRIVREQINTPAISISFEDIQEISKNNNGSITIKGKDKEDIIGIPEQIENYFSLEKQLEKIQPVIIKDKLPFLEKYQSLTGLLTAGLLLCVYTVDNKIIVGLSGSALIVLMVWSFIKVRSSKNIDSKTKKSMFWIFLVLASVICMLYFKLFVAVVH